MSPRKLAYARGNLLEHVVPRVLDLLALSLRQSVLNAAVGTYKLDGLGKTVYHEPGAIWNTLRYIIVVFPD